MEETDFPKLNIGIVGLGLIGGSIARVLTRKGLAASIVATDTEESALKKAFEDGNISRYSTSLRELEHCDLIFLCTPVGKIPSILDELSVWYKGIVTDVASTKHKIHEYVYTYYPRMRFVGGHPMAGSEKAGYTASNENLFENAPYILCRMTPASGTSDPANKEDFETVRDLAVRMAAIPIEMDPKEHDIAVGLISHLPHVVAYSLVNEVSSKGDERLKSIAAGGFRDITRIASSDPTLWTDILCDSGETVADLLEEYILILKKMAEALRDQDRQILFALFSEAKEYRDRLTFIRSAANQPVQIWVEVDDKPGMIGKIAAMFGDNKINIKNINIQDNRDYEGGTLRITVPTAEAARLGRQILEKENIKSRIVE